MNKVLFLIVLMGCFKSGSAQDVPARLTVRSEYLVDSDTLELQVWRDLIGSEGRAPYETLSMVMNDDGYYQADVEDVTSNTLISVSHSYQKIKGIPTNGIIRLVQIRQGDDIQIDLLPQKGIYRAVGGGYDNGEPVFIDNWRCRFLGVGGRRMELEQHIGQLFTRLDVDAPDLGQRAWISANWNTLDQIVETARETVLEEAKSLGEDEIHYLLFAIDAWEQFCKVKVLEQYHEMGITKKVNVDYDQMLGYIENLENRLGNNEFRDSLIFINSFRYLEAATILAELHSFCAKRKFDLANIISIAKTLSHNKRGRDRIVANILVNHFDQYPDGQILKRELKEFSDPYALSRISDKDVFVRGNMFPEFSLPSLDGTYHKLSSSRGKVVLIDFWYMACIPCRQFIETAIIPLSEKYKEDANVEIVLVSLDKESVLRKAIEDGILPDGVLALYTDNKRFKHPYILDLGLWSYPYPVLLDKQGKVVMAGAALKNKSLSSIIDEVKIAEH